MDWFLYDNGLRHERVNQLGDLQYFNLPHFRNKSFDLHCKPMQVNLHENVFFKDLARFPTYRLGNYI